MRQAAQQAAAAAATSQLAEAATAQAAARLGYVWINATIRADNHGGLTYYQSRGFRDWHYDEGVSLASGQVVDKISKRYDV